MTSQPIPRPLLFITCMQCVRPYAAGHDFCPYCNPQYSCPYCDELYAKELDGKNPNNSKRI